MFPFTQQYYCLLPGGGPPHKEALDEPAMLVADYLGSDSQAMGSITLDGLGVDTALFKDVLSPRYATI